MATSTPQRKCCIDKCLSNSNSIKVKDIVYHRFPDDPKYSKDWEQLIRKFEPSFVRSPVDFICSLHFQKSSMEAVTRRLIANAKPYFPQSAQVNSKADDETTKDLSSQSYCCIDQCTTKFTLGSNDIGFKFPARETWRKVWIDHIRIINSQEIEPDQNTRICNLHFHPLCVDSSVKPNFLKNWAKPTLFKTKAPTTAVVSKNTATSTEVASLKSPIKPHTVTTTTQRADKTSEVENTAVKIRLLKPRPICAVAGIVQTPSTTQSSQSLSAPIAIQSTVQGQPSFTQSTARQSTTSTSAHPTKTQIVVQMQGKTNALNATNRSIAKQNVARLSSTARSQSIENVPVIPTEPPPIANSSRFKNGKLVPDLIIIDDDDQDEDASAKTVKESDNISQSSSSNNTNTATNSQRAQSRKRSSSDALLDRCTEIDIETLCPQKLLSRIIDLQHKTREGAKEIIILKNQCAELKRKHESGESNEMEVIEIQ